MRTLILIGAALVPFLINIPEVAKWIPTVISAIVAIATALDGYFKPGEKSRNHYRAAEDMQQQYSWFKSDRGPYENLDQSTAFKMLQDQIDRIRHEHFIASFAFEEQEKGENASTYQTRP